MAVALRDKGFVPLKIEEKRTSALDKEISIPGFKKKVKSKEVAIISRQLATMVNSGLTLIRALNILEQQAENPLLAAIVADVRTRVEQGSSLSASMEAHPEVFNHLYVSMVRAGEVGGALDETLIRLADTLESQVRLRSKVKSAMAYPVVVLGLIILIVSGMLLFVVPIFQKMYEDLGGTLPVPTADADQLLQPHHHVLVARAGAPHRRRDRIPPLEARPRRPASLGSRSSCGRRSWATWCRRSPSPVLPAPCPC